MWGRKSPRASTMTRRSFLGRLAGGAAAACLYTGIPLSALPAPVRRRAADDAFQKFVSSYEQGRMWGYDVINHQLAPLPLDRYGSGLLAYVSQDFCDDLVQCPADSISVERTHYDHEPIPAIPFREYHNVMILVRPGLTWGEIRFERA